MVLSFCFIAFMCIYNTTSDKRSEAKIEYLNAYEETVIDLVTLLR